MHGPEPALNKKQDSHVYHIGGSGKTLKLGNKPSGVEIPSRRHFQRGFPRTARYAKRRRIAPMATARAASLLLDRSHIQFRDLHAPHPMVGCGASFFV
jgi:hypothetical protein